MRKSSAGIAAALAASLALPAAAATRPARKPAIDPAIAASLIEGTWTWVPKAETTITKKCDAGFYMRFYRKEGRIRRAFSDAASSMGAVFTFGLSAVGPDDYVTRIAPGEGGFEIDVATRPGGDGGYRRRLVFERKDPDLVDFTGYGEIDRKGVARVEPAGLRGGLFRRCHDKKG